MSLYGGGNLLQHSRSGALDPSSVARATAAAAATATMQNGDNRDHQDGLGFGGYGGTNEAGMSVIPMAEHHEVQLEQRASGGDGSRRSEQFMAINSAQAYNPLTEPYFHYNALLQATTAAPTGEHLCAAPAPPPTAENLFGFPHHNPADFPPLINLLSSSSSAPSSLPATSAAATPLFHAHHPHTTLQQQAAHEAAVNLRDDPRQNMYSPHYNILIANHDIAGDHGLRASLTGHTIDNQHNRRALPSTAEACNSASANTDVAADAARVSTTSTNNSVDTADNIGEDDAAKGADPVRAKIIAHPSYPRLVVAYMNCHKVGAPPDIASSLDEISRKYETFHDHAAPSAITAFGHDPELDEFMEAYCDILHKYHEELTRPFTESMLFFRKIEQQLNALCKSSPSTLSSSALPGSQPGWSDDQGGGSLQDLDGNGGGGAGLMLSEIVNEQQEEAGAEDHEEEDEGGSGEIIDYVHSNSLQDSLTSNAQHQNIDSAVSTMMLMSNMQGSTLGHPGTSVVDPQAEEQRIKAQLLRKYSGYFTSLKKEFLKKKKKGKLPKDARQKLLDWWTQHYRWPYPSEAEKTALAESTGLDQKQINNWFINQRKRHWKPSEDMQCVMMINLHASADNPDNSNNTTPPLAIVNANHNINNLAVLSQACHINANVKDETDNIMNMDQR